jgi:hypothetical protein
MTKLLAVRYPSSVDRVRGDTDHLRKIVDIEDVNIIKNLIGELLFNINNLFRYNYCLIKHDNKLYVIEPTDYEKNTYSRKLVGYHPMSHML